MRERSSSTSTQAARGVWTSHAKLLVFATAIFLCQAMQIAHAKGSYYTTTTPGNVSRYGLSPTDLAEWACVNSVEYRNNYSWFACAGLLTYAPGTTYGNISKYWWGYYHNGNGPYPYYAITWHANAYPENKEITCGQPSTCHPIQIGVGNKRLVEEDFSVGSIKLRRYYNSIDGSHRASFGAGWGHLFSSQIQNPVTGVALVRRGSGRELSYVLDASSNWTNDADVNDRLIELKDAAGVRTGWRYFSAAEDHHENYNASGVLQSIEPMRGPAQALTHTDGTNGTVSGNGGYVLDAAGSPTTTVLPAGLLLRVVDSHGHGLTFGYDSLSRVVLATSSGSTIARYSYDTRGNLSTVTYADNTVKTYLYGEAGYIASGSSQPYALTGVRDENNVRYASYWYNSNGRAYDEKIAEGSFSGVGRSQLSYTLNSGNVVSTSVTDALGAARVYGFSKVEGVNRLTSLSVSGGATSNVTNDANGNVTSSTDQNGNQTTYTYDLSRNLEMSRTEAYGTARARTITTQWHSTYRLHTQIDEPGRRTTYTHDANGNVLTRTILDTSTNESRTWTYTYNSFGQVLTADGPRIDVSDVTTYTYYNCSTGYECGQVETITNALGHVTTYNSYNAHGQPLTITDPNGVVTTLTYDARQRLTSRTVGTELTGFEYWPTGLLKKATMPDGSYLEYTYDAAHRLTDIYDAEGNHIHYTLDAMGNRTAEEMLDPSSALSRTRMRVFSTLNRLQQELGAAGTPQVTTTFGYDNNDNQTSIDAPLGRSTLQSYDELNRLSTVTDPENGVTTYGYNGLDQLISVTDPRNLTTSYTYNGLGDLKTQVSPDTGTTTNTYDSGGNLKTSTNARNVVSTYTYDALNRVKTAAFKVNTTTDQTITYNYDAGTNGIGQLTSASDSAHSMSWTYDPIGRVLSKTQTVTSIARTVGYGHTNGLLTSLTTPSGQAVAYGYTNGQVTSITINGTTLLSNALYDPFGPVRQWTWGNGTLSVRTYDEDGRIEQIDSAGLNTYSYDDAFRITGITDTTNSALSWTYGYDESDRLTSATRSTDETFGWTYDADGNRLTQTGSSAQTLTYPTTSNRVSGVSGAITQTYAYNSPGDLTGNGTRTFQYNNRGRMKSTTLGSNITSYIYNALGQRIKKGVSRIFVYDEAGHLLGEYNNTGALVQETIWLGDTPVATIRPKTGGVDIFYVHTDHLDTPRKITRPSDNKLRWRWDPAPFGTGLPNDNPEALGVFGYNLRFPGQYYDTESGLHYNYYRDYDPATGRYVQSDPIGLEGGLNTYAYVHSNPLSLTDPFGLATSVTVRCGPVMSGGVHCEVIATCEGQAKSFQIGGPEGATDWEKVWKGLYPPKTPITDPKPPAPDQTDYAATCTGDDCGCKAFECLEKAFNDATPPRYYALWQNSNTFAHSLLNKCGCSVNPLVVTTMHDDWTVYSRSPRGALGWW